MWYLSSHSYAAAERVGGSWTSFVRWLRSGLAQLRRRARPRSRKPIKTVAVESVPPVAHAAAVSAGPEVSPRPGRKPSWRVLGASVAGQRHIQQGRPCEDAAAWFARNDVLFLVVADGAGSARLGRLGSGAAVRAAMHAGLRLCLARRSITAGQAWRIVRAAVQHADRRLHRQAASLGAAPHDLACTLIAVLATPEFVAVAQVGDGAVVVSDGDARLLALTKPAKGEFANETSLLGCDPAVEMSLRGGGEVSFRAVAAFTDGLEQLSLQMPAGTPHAGFFTPLFEGLRTLPTAEADQALRQLLRSPRVAARSDDDKTLLVAQLVCT